MAHQDDEMHCLGTLLKCKQRGDTIGFITVTDGSKGFVQSPDISRSEASKIRYREMSSLAGSVGADYVSLGELDEFLYDTPEVRMKLIEAIRRFKADVVFTHFQEDYNLDHITVNSLVRHCTMHSSLPVLPTVSPALTAAPSVYMIEPHGPIHFPAECYVDISEFYEKKIALLRLHQSQETAMQQALGSGLGELVCTVSAFRGLQSGVRHAEAFIPMRTRSGLKPYPVLP